MWRKLKSSLSAETGNAAAFNISLLLRAASLGSMALSGLLLAKLMLPAQYGIYGHALALSSLAAIFGAVGVETFLIREVGAAGGRKMERGLRSSLLRHALKLVSVAALLMAAILFFVLTIFGTKGAAKLSGLSLFAVLLMVPTLSLIAVFKGVAKGERRFIAAQFPDGVLRPWLMMSIVVLFFALGYDINVELAVQFYSASLLVALVLLLSLSKPITLLSSSSVAPDPGWTRACLALLLVSAVMVFNRRLDVLMLGFMVDEVATGSYVLATRIADGLTLFFTAFSISFAARSAELLKTGQLDKLQTSLRKSTRMVFALTLVAAVLVTVFASPLLGWFNAAYSQAAEALTILAFAQLVNTAFGLTGLLLVLSNDQAWYSWLLLLGAVGNALLNLWLIPALGISGAAIATLAITLVWNAMAWLRLRRKLGLDSSIAGRGAVYA